ncbi:MAG: hypothetical protein AAGC55_04005, partial [Myxococcota bacterium]
MHWIPNSRTDATRGVIAQLQWNLAGHDQRCVDFEISDRTGDARVDTNGAELLLTQSYYIDSIETFGLPPAAHAVLERYGWHQYSG